MLEARLIKALRDRGCTKTLCLPELVHQCFAVITKHNTPPTADDLEGAHPFALLLHELGARGSMRLCLSGQAVPKHSVTPKHCSCAKQQNRKKNQMGRPRPARRCCLHGAPPAAHVGTARASCCLLLVVGCAAGSRQGQTVGGIPPQVSEHIHRVQAAQHGLAAAACSAANR